MSFRDLVGAGGACGGENPLLKFSSQVRGSRGDGSKGAGGLHANNTRRAKYGPSITDSFTEEFLQHGQQQHQGPPPAAAIQGNSHFRMDSLLREMRDIESMPSATASARDDWVEDFAYHQPAGVEDQWSRDFLGPIPKSASALQSGYRHSGPGILQRLEPNGSSSSKWADEYLSEKEIPILAKREERDRLKEVANEILATPHGEDFSNSEFFNFVRDISSGKTELVGKEFVQKGNSDQRQIQRPGQHHRTDGKHFCREKDNIECECCHEGKKADPKSTAEEWTEQFVDFTDQDFAHFVNKGKSGESAPPSSYGQDFWTSLESEWKDMARSPSSSTAHPWLSEFNDEGLDQAWNSYHFKEDNPLKEHPQALNQGKIKLQQGDIPSAVLLFEAAVQQNPEDSEAWCLLGTTQAKNEQDISAIAALRRSLRLEPKDSVAMMSLAVSLTNESYQAQACVVLQEWIHHNPSYTHLNPALSPAIPPEHSSFMSPELHAKTIDMFLNAARLQPDSKIDPDVQSGLGILFNLSGEYDKAVDCFKAALQVRPEDAQLWNKLGATLANGSRSEEAVSAYHNALRFSPGFVRSRYNLGISCMNLKAYREATEHFLTALNFQSAGRGLENGASASASAGSSSVMSESIWSSLRLCMSLMDRRDLLPDIESRNLDRINSALVKQAA